MRALRIRGGSGLGDALYLRPFVEHLVTQGEKVTVCSNYPEVFLGSGAEVDSFSRNNIQLLIHYTKYKAGIRSNQWEDLCTSARFTPPFAMRWGCRNPKLVARVRALAAGRRWILVHGGRPPMGRADGFGKELLPKREAFVAVLDRLREQNIFTVRVGRGGNLYKLPVDLDLTDETSVADLIDLGQACDGVLAQCSLAVPLAEIFDTPLLVIWSAEGLTRARHAYVRQITPKKVLSKKSSLYIIDEWPAERATQGVEEFVVKVRPKPCVITEGLGSAVGLARGIGWSIG